MDGFDYRIPLMACLEICSGRRLTFFVHYDVKGYTSTSNSGDKQNTTVWLKNLHSPQMEEDIRGIFMSGNIKNFEKCSFWKNWYDKMFDQ